MACRSLDKANAAKAQIEAGGITGSISTVQLDVTDDESIQKAAAFVEQQFGRLDVLINNAAWGVSDLDRRTHFLRTMETTYTGPFRSPSSSGRCCSRPRRPPLPRPTPSTSPAAWAPSPTRLIPHPIP